MESNETKSGSTDTSNTTEHPELQMMEREEDTAKRSPPRVIERQMQLKNNIWKH